ncbi:hypothetical protein B0H14DRAFT_3432470 [Mycena olivaceomarginata]|nr:hypothetical protein B0H14DRAFT_3432470 [Mycena olivaceomarginata]
MPLLVSESVSTSSERGNTYPVYLDSVPLNTEYHPPGSFSPEIKFKNSDARKYATALRDRQLIISVTVPSQGLMSPAEFSRQISAPFAAHNITIPPFPEDVEAGAADDLDGQLWSLLQIKLRKGTYSVAEHPTIQTIAFGYKEFVALNKKFANVLANRPWAWIGPRFGPLVGPISSFSTAETPLSGCHPCFGSRVLFPLPRAHNNRNDRLEPKVLPP